MKVYADNRILIFNFVQLNALKFCISRTKPVDFFITADKLKDSFFNSNFSIKMNYSERNYFLLRMFNHEIKQKKLFKKDYVGIGFSTFSKNFVN